MKLLQDLGMRKPKPTSKRPIRYGLFECPKCLNVLELIKSNGERNSACKSCSQKTHGGSKHKLFKTWVGEHRRCTDPNFSRYENYGARGISVAKEFEDFNAWLTYVETLNNAYKEGYTLDRIDNNGNYERGNLRWANRSTQQRNTQRLNSQNTSGYRGVIRIKTTGKWRAQIKINSKSTYLGYFTYPWTAAYAYDSYVITNNLEHTKNF